MTQYFFHLHGPEGRSDDLLGCEFDNVEAAYLEASRAAVEISNEMLVRREDPTGLRFEICDERLGPVLDLPFREALRGQGGPWLRFQCLREQMAGTVAHGHRIREELADHIQTARAALAAIRQTMDLPTG